MATGPSQTKVDGTTARSAVTKSAKLLRLLLSKQDNRKQLIDHDLLPKEISTGNPIKELQQTMLKKSELFTKLVNVVSKLPGGSDAAEKLREGEKKINVDIKFIIINDYSLSESVRAEGQRNKN